MWLKLTLKSNGQAVYVNMDNVIRFQPSTSGGSMVVSAVEKGEGSEKVYVTETAEMIAGRLRTADVIVN